MAQSSNYTAILAQIKTLLESVPGVGNVYSRQRRTTSWSEFTTLFQHPTEDYLSGWMISRSGVQESRLTNIELATVHDFLLTGIYSVNDGLDSETTFQGHIEDVRDVFRADYNLSGTAEFTDPLTNITIDYWMFGSVLCHRCTAHLAVHERLTGGQ